MADCHDVRLSLVVIDSAADIAPASAYTWTCGKFSGSDPLIRYKFTQVAGWGHTAVNGAAAAWNGKSVPGTFGETTGTPEIDIYDNAYGTQWWAVTEGSCSGGQWGGNHAAISINTQMMDSMTAYQQKLVMEHELGHAYGLDHVSMTCADDDALPKAVMEQGSGKFSCSGAAPWDDDQDGVRNKY